MDSAGKRVRVKWNRRTGHHCRPVLQLPTGQFSQLANMLLALKILAHMEMNRGQSKMNGGKMLRRAVGMAWQRRAGTQPAEQSHCRRTQPADSPPGTGLKKHNSQQLAGLAAKQQPPIRLAGPSPCSAG